MEADEEDLAEFLDPKARGDSTYAVTEGGVLAGFFSVSHCEDQSCEIGLGLRPDLTGKGKGYGFLKAGIEFVQTKYKPDKITLSVAAFNQRAIKVYQKLGFQEAGTFPQETNGGTYEFVKMVR